MSYFDDNEARLIGLPAVLPPIRSVRRYTPPTPLEQRTAERDAARDALEVQCAQTRDALAEAAGLLAELGRLRSVALAAEDLLAALDADEAWTNEGTAQSGMQAIALGRTLTTWRGAHQ